MVNKHSILTPRDELPFLISFCWLWVQNGETFLIWAVSKNDKEVVVELVRAGVNVNEKNEVRQLLTYFHHNNVIVIIIILLFVVVVWKDSSHVGC